MKRAAKEGADVLFVHSIHYPFIGLMSISAVLKQNGYRADVLIESSPQRIGKYVRQREYALVGFPVMIGEEKLMLQRAAAVKAFSPETKIILGGMYPTLQPEAALRSSMVDYICRGEGEYPILELIRALKGDGDDETILNLWGRRNNRVFKNELRELNNLDWMPHLDFSLYRRYTDMYHNPSKTYIVSRGCPYACSFCYNKTLRQTFKECGSYIRVKKARRVVEEIEHIKHHARLETLFLMDDTFLISRTVLLEFSELFPKLDVELVVMVRADQINERTVMLLKKCRTRCVLLAIETGDENYRMNILNKKVSNAQIIDAVRLLKAKGILVVSLNMMGLPNETVDMALLTVDLNIKAGVDFASIGFYCPYPGVWLTEYAARIYGLDDGFTANLPSDYTSRPLLPLPEAERLLNIQRLASFVVRFRRFRKLLPILLNLPPNFLFESIFNGMRIYEFKKQTAASWISVLLYGMSHFRQRKMLERA